MIEGVPYDMNPAPTRRHQQIVGRLFAQIFNALEGKICEPYLPPFDIRLPEYAEDAQSASTVVQPDLAVICDPSQLNEQGSIGPPALIIEVLSPRTVTKDWREKRRLYERAGVREYWIVSPTDETVIIFTLQQTGGYSSPVVYGNNEMAPVTVLEGVQIDLALVFA